ncbi:hypothetical protein K438DRAFT_2168183 [Mycena galopus ATCC 62051]|nr:hypothetical protein K438DRAFT_2168183 [Mycena galopus ATCC 62051]
MTGPIHNVRPALPRDAFIDQLRVRAEQRARPRFDVNATVTVEDCTFAICFTMKQLEDMATRNPGIIGLPCKNCDLPIALWDFGWYILDKEDNSLDPCVIICKACFKYSLSNPQFDFEEDTEIAPQCTCPPGSMACQDILTGCQLHNVAGIKEALPGRQHIRRPKTRAKVREDLHRLFRRRGLAWDDLSLGAQPLPTSQFGSPVMRVWTFLNIAFVMPLGQPESQLVKTLIYCNDLELLTEMYWWLHAREASSGANCLIWETVKYLRFRPGKSGSEFSGLSWTLINGTLNIFTNLYALDDLWKLKQEGISNGEPYGIYDEDLEKIARQMDEVLALQKDFRNTRLVDFRMPPPSPPAPIKTLPPAPGAQHLARPRIEEEVRFQSMFLQLV